ncbi:MAG: SDR family NAD(P)-dependent oxidoreductase [Spirochaetaceae bacterium]|nr:MAG: SDR family NAD(P)-dependent oxidoreductase [Spirochaetaceae bacterium]
MEDRTAFVTGADHGLGLALTAGLLDRGWTVVAGRYNLQESALEALRRDGDHADRLTTVALDVSDSASVAEAARVTLADHPTIDLVVNNAAILGNRGLEHRIADGLDYDSIAETINVNSLGALRVVEALLPGVERSPMRRLCFVSSEAGSIARSHRPNWFGYSMSKCALNMAVSILFNDLRPRGYSFRVYHPGWMQTFMRGTPDTRATHTPQAAARLALEYFLDLEIDEDRLVMRDDRRDEWPW